MKTIRTLILVTLSLFTPAIAIAGGTWTKLTNVAPSTVDQMFLLPDGTVMALQYLAAGSATWYRLTPSTDGHYIAGTWSSSSIAAMHNTRLYFSSRMLQDGRVFIAGGDLGNGQSTAEVYDPTTNVWTLTPSAGQSFRDASSEILPDGRVLVAPASASPSQSTIIWNPTSNTWTTGPTTGGSPVESTWVKLPDNSILLVDRSTTNSERYIPSLNQFTTDASVPVTLYDPYIRTAGAAFLLPNGKAFFLGATGHTAIYTPSGSTANGSWVAGPDIPNSSGATNAPAAMLPNGKILCAVSPVPTSGTAPSPVSFYEFDYTTNSFAPVTTPTGSPLSQSTDNTTMLMLPDGTVLFSLGTNQLYSYQPDGTPLTAAKPTIASIQQTSDDSNDLILGTLLNGISEGTCYGNENQNATNYPIVRLTSTSTGTVYYARTYGWSSTGVMTGATYQTAYFSVPATVPRAASYTVELIANGVVSSNTKQITLKASPTFTGLSVPATATYGADLSPVSGTIKAGTLVPPTTEKAYLEIGGANYTLSFNTSGFFPSGYSYYTLQQSGPPFIQVGSHPYNFDYYGDSNFNFASDSSKTLTVTKATPSFSSMVVTTAPSFGTSVAVSGKISAGTNALGYAITAPGETVSISINGRLYSATIAYDGTFSTSINTTNFVNTSDVLSKAYTLTVSYGGDSNFNAATNYTATVTVSKAATTFSSLTASSKIAQGATINLTGYIVAGSATPPTTETISVTINGIGITTPIAADGSFNASFNTSSIPAAPTAPYTITYSYAADNHFNAATNTSTTLTVQYAPVFSNLRASQTVGYGTTAITLSGKIATATGSAPPTTESVSATINGTTTTGLIGSGGNFSFTFDPSAIPVGSSIPITYKYAGDTNFAPAPNDSSTTLTVTKATPSFSNLTASQSISYGTASISLSGKIASGSVSPQTTETVSITINGVTVTPTIGSGGNFTASLPSQTIPASASSYTITYSYAGDSNFNGATNTSTTLTVNKITPSFSNLTGSQSISYGTASISLSGKIASGSILPPTTETVSITINGVTVIPTIGSGGNFAVSFASQSIPASASSYTITYSYAGDSNFNTATNTSTTLTVNKVTPSFSSLTASQTIGYGTASISLSGKIASGSASPSTTETVSITINGVTVTPTIGSGGNFTASFNTSTIPAAPAAPYTISYGYGGDSNFNSATDTSTTLTVNKPTPSFNNLTTSQAISYGTTSINLSGQIGNGATAPPPPVTVSITINGATVTAAIGSGGNFSASFATQSIPASPSSYSITYSYAGDSNLGPTTNASTTLTVTKATPSFSNLTASQSISYGTASISLSGKIASGSVLPPTTETVSITINGVTVTPTIGSGGNFTASFNTSTIPAAPAAPYTISYGYGGDSNFNSATDTSTKLTVNKVTPSFSNLTASQSIAYGAVSINVAGHIATGAVSPSGNVSITINGATTTIPIGNGGDFAAAFATQSIPAAPASPYSIAYQYAGDGNFNNASDTSTSLTVGKATPAFSDLSASQTIGYGATINLSGKIATDTAVPPTGELVSITINGISVAATISAGGNFTTNFATQAIPASASSYAITYAYTGDGNLNGATEASTTLKVNQAVAAFTNLTASQVISYGTTITVAGKVTTQTVSPPNTESVSISVNGQAMPAMIGSGGNFTATLATKAVPAAPSAPYTISYTYAGDGNFIAVSDTSTTLTVNKATPIFSDLASHTITQGSAAITLDGKIAAGTVYPPTTESVSIAISGGPAAVTPMIASDGSFTASVDTSSIPAAPSTPLTISYTYAGDANFNSISDTSTKLIVRGADPTHAQVFGTGDLVPRSGPAGFLPLGAAFTNLGVPAIDDEGNVVFVAQWLSPGGSGRGIFTTDRYIVVTGYNADLNATFSDPVIDAGHVAFLMKSAHTSLLSDAPTDALAPIATTGDEAPGTNGARFKSFKAVAVHGKSVAFLGQLTPRTGLPKVTPDDDLSLWVVDDTHPLHAPILREGQQIEGRTIKTLVGFANGNGSPGQGRGWLTVRAGSPKVLALVMFTDKTQAVVSADPTGAITILSESGPAGAAGPTSGGTFASYGIPATNELDHVAFLGTFPLGGEVSKANARGIFVDLGGDGLYESIARVGSPAGSTGATFSVLKDPVLADDDYFAFPATLNGNGISSGTRSTLWWNSSGGTAITLLAQGGKQAPGTLGGLWKSFPSLAIAAKRGPLFIGLLTVNPRNGFTKANTTGAWAVDLNGDLRLLFRAGVTQVNSKVVKTFTLLNALPGSTGLTRSFNNAGQVAWRAAFADKSQAIVITEVP